MGTFKFMARARLFETRRTAVVSNPGNDPPDSDQELEKRFRALVEEWKKQRGPISSITRLSMHYAYQQIIALGPKAIPLLLRELERQPDHWFWALKVLTGTNPVPKEVRGNLDEMARHWVAWGKAQGYKW